MAKERYVFESPEKIYIDDFGSGFSHDWHTEHSYEKDIEYIRKDVIIEKVVNFLNYKLNDVVFTRVSGTIIPHYVAKQELIEDIIKILNYEIDR